MTLHDLGARTLTLGLTLLLGASLGCDEGDASDDTNIREHEDEGELELDVDVCAAQVGVDDCLARVGCTPIYAEPLRVTDEGNACTDSERFVACAATVDPCPNPHKLDCEPCPALGTVYCDEEGEPWLASGCSMPESMPVCEAPGPIVGGCS